MIVLITHCIVMSSAHFLLLSTVFDRVGQCSDLQTQWWIWERLKCLRRSSWNTSLPWEKAHTGSVTFLTLGHMQAIYFLHNGIIWTVILQNSLMSSFLSCSSLSDVTEYSGQVLRREITTIPTVLHHWGYAVYAVSFHTCKSISQQTTKLVVRSVV